MEADSLFSLFISILIILVLSKTYPVLSSCSCPQVMTHFRKSMLVLLSGSSIQGNNKNEIRSGT
jgi:hypothetical protein